MISEEDSNRTPYSVVRRKYGDSLGFDLLVMEASLVVFGTKIFCLENVSFSIFEEVGELRIVSN